MTLRHFRIFKAVAETGSFTKAAEQLYITQSAVSHAMRELEEMAGTVFFDRLSKSIKITESGRIFLEEITPILSSCDVLESRIQSLEYRSPIRIVSSITIAAFWLPAILKDFQEKRPDIPVSVEVVSAAAAAEVLRKGDADIALVEGTVPQGPFESAVFASYAMQIVCAPGFLNGKCHLNLEEFCREKLLLREKGSAIRDALDSALYLAGKKVYPVWTSVNSMVLIEAAKAGFGITVLPEILVQSALDEGKLVAVEAEGLKLGNEMMAVWHRDKYMTEPLRTLLLTIENELET